MRKKIKKFSLLLFLSFNAFSLYSNVKSYWEIKFLEVDRQISEFSCGAAVLATLFTYYFGIPVKEEEILGNIFKKIVEEKRGISFLDMKKFVHNYGFDVYGYRLNFGGLVRVFEENCVPVIVQTKKVFQGKEEFHFSLLVGIVDGYIILKDTSVGNIVVSYYDFLSKWTGYTLLIRPNIETILINVSNKVKKEKERTAKYVSKIYFYQYHPKRFYNSFFYPFNK